MRKTNKNRQKRSQANAIAFSTVATTAIVSLLLIKNYGTLSVPACNVYRGDYTDLIVCPVNELYDVASADAITEIPAVSETNLIASTQISCTEAVISISDTTLTITTDEQFSDTEETATCTTTLETTETCIPDTIITHDVETTTAEMTTTLHQERPEIYDCPLADSVQEYIYSRANYYNIDYELIMAIIKAESNYNACAYSGSSHGLMQINNINYSLAIKLGVNNLYDPCGNVLVGTYLLNDLLTRHNVKDALICYNVGEYAAEQLGLLGTDTAYTDKVLEYYYDYTYHNHQ